MWKGTYIQPGQDPDIIPPEKSFNQCYEQAKILPTYLHKYLLAVSVDERHEGLHLPRHIHQLGDEAGRRFDRVLLRHGERVYGALQKEEGVELGVDKQSRLLFQHLGQHGEKTVDQVGLVGHGGAGLDFL